MRFRSTTLGLAATLVSTMAAFGADLPGKSSPPPPPMPAPVANWSGFYVGAFIGGLDGSFSTSQGASANGSSYGVNTGTLAGFNFQSGSIVFGVEGDVAANSLSHKFAGRPGLVGNEIESVYELHGRARVGYDLGNFLPFVAGGAAVNHLFQYQTYPNDFDGAARTQLGWTIGVGVDAKVALPILGPSTLRAEYLYEGLPSATYGLAGPQLRTSVGVNEVRLALITPIGANWQPSPQIGPADWSGVYFGALGGGARQTISTKGLGASDNFNASGGFGGVYTGENWMFGNAMLGLEGSTTFGAITGDGPQPGAAATHYNEYFDTDFLGRAGWAFGRFLPFVAAGAAWSDSEQTDKANGNFRGAVSDVSGVVGVGLDYMASDRIAIRAEYRHAETLGTVSTHLDSETCCNQSRSSDEFRFGLAYFFH